MVYTGYLAVGGTLIVDNARTAAYAAALGVTAVQCDACEYPPGVYTTPKGDLAPWYDPAVPESADFAGILGLAITGVASTSTLTVTERLNDGAVAGRTRRAHRELHLSGAILAASEAGASYGMAWVSSALQQACTPDPSCNGGTAQLYAACPDQTEEVTLARTLRGVKVLQSLSDPGTISQLTSSCVTGKQGWIWSTDLIIAAMDPFVYWPAHTFTTGAGQGFIPPTLWPTSSTWWVDDGTTAWAMPDCSQTPPPGPDPVCAPVGQCLVDPTCPPPTAPPLPPIPTDPCTVVVPNDPLVCSINIDTTAMPTALPSVPVLQITAGSGDMRRTLIRYYKGHPGEGCNWPHLDPCDIIGEHGMPYLPKGSTVTIDGANRTATVLCPDGSTANAMLYDSRGPATTWPVLDCSTAYCVVVVTENTVAADAYVNLALLPRAEAL